MKELEGSEGLKRGNASLQTHTSGANKMQAEARQVAEIAPNRQAFVKSRSKNFKGAKVRSVEKQSCIRLHLDETRLQAEARQVPEIDEGNLCAHTNRVKELE